jgi:hypothetical protein
MALETADYIDGLVSSNPAASDKLGAADDHLRLVKKVLLQSFPNISGAMTCTEAFLNGLSDRLDALEAGQVQNLYDVMWPINSVMVRIDDDEPTVPDDVVATWTAVGAGYVMKSVASGAGATSGSDTLTSGAGGNHNHGGATLGHALTAAENGPHTHYIARDGSSSTNGLTSATYMTDEGGYGEDSKYILCRTTSTPNVGKTSESGSGSAHAHTISVSGTHTHSVDVSTQQQLTVRVWKRTA